MYSLCLTIGMIIIKCCIIFVAGISVENLYLTIVMIIIKYCMYVCCWNKCGNVHCSFNFISFNPICEKTRNNALLIFLYVLVNP